MEGSFVVNKAPVLDVMSVLVLFVEVEAGGEGVRESVEMGLETLDDLQNFSLHLFAPRSQHSDKVQTLTLHIPRYLGIIVQESLHCLHKIKTDTLFHDKLLPMI